MNGVRLASRLMFLAAQCRGEAERQTPALRDELLAQSRQLSYAMHSAYSKDPDVQQQAVALVEATIDHLVDAVTARTERELTKGTP